MDVILTIFGWLFFGVGGIASIIGGLWLLGLAFGAGILWGLGYLFVPFVSLFFIVSHWQEAKKPFLLQLGGGIVAFLGILLIGVSAPDQVPFGLGEPDDDWAYYEDETDEVYAWESEDDANGIEQLKPREEWTPPQPSNRLDDRRRAPLPSSVDFDDATKLLGEKVRVVKVSGNRFEGRLDRVDDGSIEVVMYSGAGRMNVTISAHDIDRIELIDR
ncbi:MAG: hypothetical protein AAGC60_04025 [Acidobacteriota bacterium]